MLAFELFFGRSIQGQSEVTDSAWEDFLDTVVTPNLPNGYTVFDGTGAWLNPATKRPSTSAPRSCWPRCRIHPPALPPSRGSGRPTQHNTIRFWSE